MDDNVPRKPRILLTGDFKHPDFDRVRTWLAQTCELQELPQPADLRASSHELALLCQSRPGQFAQVDVESLHRAAPLAGLIALLGTWCEGEARSGRPWHGIERVYWYEAIGHLRQLLAHPQQGLRTETVAERILRQSWQPPAMRGIAVIAGDRREYEPLADLCRALQMTPHRYEAAATLNVTPSLILVAADDLASSGLSDTVISLRRQWPQARMVALLNFPRQHEVAALESAGCNAVLGKPVMLGDLAGVVR